METLTITSIDCQFELSIQEYDGEFTLCLTEYEVDEEKTRKNHTYYKASSVTEVYFGYEELGKIAKAFSHFIGRDNN